MERKLPTCCPSCGHLLRVKRFECPTCETLVDGDFALPVLGRLREDEQIFVQQLIKCSGSLKDLAQVYKVSYPTVRNRLDALIGRIEALEADSATPGREDKDS